MCQAQLCGSIVGRSAWTNECRSLRLFDPVRPPRVPVPAQRSIARLLVDRSTISSAMVPAQAITSKTRSVYLTLFMCDQGVLYCFVTSSVPKRGTRRKGVRRTGPATHTPKSLASLSWPSRPYRARGQPSCGKRLPPHTRGGRHRRLKRRGRRRCVQESAREAHSEERRRNSTLEPISDQSPAAQRLLRKLAEELI